ncbi:helix-turn-helix domain-containing protein [Alicyclobacillus dauci]|uniref:Helix-turn-helix domain-containing protein n=1 Tax=Alicyclobacillus dauci TaxID=1475485 RepID=A0ABY6Z4Z9_9BACL|nr:helix-turn-helix domain-containing protein [Alicyclobacillus dauci]WAH37732.1 helix-turn-helix domain-containing protein [Alicyclobacillus dauci]
MKMTIKTHLSTHSELSGLTALGERLPGRLPAVILALKQQELIHREISQMIQDLNPSEREALEDLMRENPGILGALHQAGIVRVSLGRKPQKAANVQPDSFGVASAGDELENQLGSEPLHIEMSVVGKKRDFDGTIDVELPEFLSTKTVSEILGITPQMVRRYCQSKEIKATRTMGLGGDWRIETKDFIQQDPTREQRLRKLLARRADCNTLLTDKVAQLGAQPNFQKLLDGVDERRQLDKQRRGLEDK